MDGRIRVLILCPTSELTVQVGSVARRVSPKGVRVMVATGGPERPIKTQADMLREGVDVMVATVGRVVTLLDRDCLDLSGVGSVVLDEVDVMVSLRSTATLPTTPTTPPRPHLPPLSLLSLISHARSSTRAFRCKPSAPQRRARPFSSCLSAPPCHPEWQISSGSNSQASNW